MKKLFNFFSFGALIVSSMYLYSCDSAKENYSGANMSLQGSIDASLKFVTDECIEETDYITKVVFHPRPDRGVTRYSSKMTMYLYTEGNDSIYEWTYGLSVKDGQFSQPEDVKSRVYATMKKENPRENAIQYKNIDFSHIAEYINEAGKQVEEMGKESGERIPFSGVGKYTILLNSDPTKIKHKFIIESRDSIKSTKIRDIFYEFPFEVGADGKVVPTKK